MNFGAFAGGLSNGIQSGTNLAAKKQAFDTQKKNATNSDLFNKFLAGAVANDRSVLDPLYQRYNMTNPNSTVTPGGTMASNAPDNRDMGGGFNPGAGLGSL